MREAIKSSVSGVWHACASHPAIRLPDVIVQIQQDRQDNINYSISHESTFQRYIESLLTTEVVQSSVTPNSRDEYSWASLDSLQFLHVLGGRGYATLVRSSKTPDSDKYVYKGLGFFQFLESTSGFKTEKDAFYHELGLVFKLPHHSNIIHAPSIMVTTEKPHDNNREPLISSKKYVCGALYPYHERQSLQEVIEAARADKVRISPTRKAKWAHQISSAMAAVHSSQQFHMDLKPSNTLLDGHDDIIIIDWEQLGASPFFIAPEATGMYDAELVPSDMAPEATTAIYEAALIATNISKTTNPKPAKNTQKIRYKSYTGPIPLDSYAWPHGNVFPIWQRDCPPALEAAEVFSLGRTLWIIFQQISEECFTSPTEKTIDDSVVADDNREIYWNSDSDNDDIPQTWKDFVARATSADPNARGRFVDAVEFWRDELERREVECAEPLTD